MLEDRGHLRGRVGGADGSASVGAVRDGTHAFALQIPTSREGSFDLPDLDPSPFVLVAYADGRAPYVEPGITVGPGEEAEREVSLTPGGCLKVRFATREGAKAALEDGFLTFAGYDLGWLLRSVAPPTVTDAGKDGSEAVFPRLAAGVYWVSCGDKPKEALVSEGAESTIECH